MKTKLFTLLLCFCFIGCKQHITIKINSSGKVEITSQTTLKKDLYVLFSSGPPGDSPDIFWAFREKVFNQIAEDLGMEKAKFDVRYMDDVAMVNRYFEVDRIEDLVNINNAFQAEVNDLWFALEFYPTCVSISDFGGEQAASMLSFLDMPGIISDEDRKQFDTIIEFIRSKTDDLSYEVIVITPNKPIETDLEMENKYRHKFMTSWNQIAKKHEDQLKVFQIYFRKLSTKIRIKAHKRRLTILDMIKLRSKVKKINRPAEQL